MRGAVMYGPGDVRVDERDDPKILEPTDAIVRLPATCICGSDLWPWRGIDDDGWPAPMGHEYAGFVEEVGSEVRTIRPGAFVVGSFFASDNTCELCRAGYQTACVNREAVGPGARTGDPLHPPAATSATSAFARRGGPGEELVYSHDPAMDERGSIKVLLPLFGGNRTLRDRGVRAARLLSRPLAP